MFHNTNISLNSETGSYAPAVTVLKAFKILEYLGNHQPVLPGHLVKDLGLSRATVHRLLATLINIGYVTRVAGEGYKLTFKLFKLGSTVPISQDLREVAKPFMIELSNLAQENTYLTVLCEDIVIAIDEVKSQNHLTLNPNVTYTYPIYACGSGKVFMAAMAKDYLNEVLAKLPFEKKGINTIINRENLLQALAVIQEQGYAKELQEFSDDLNSMSAPIFDYRKQVVATVAISGPAIRLTEKRLDELVPHLLRIAGVISEQLGKSE